MTTAEYATQHSVSVSTVRRWCREGRLQAQKLGRRWLIKAANAALKVAGPIVEAVREVVAPAEPRRSLWAYRGQLHGW